MEYNIAHYAQKRTKLDIKRVLQCVQVKSQIYLKRQQEKDSKKIESSIHSELFNIVGSDPTEDELENIEDIVKEDDEIGTKLDQVQRLLDSDNIENFLRSSWKTVTYQKI